MKKYNFVNILYFIITICIVILGIKYRTEVWLYEPGFFGDEGSLVTNIQTRNVFELLFAAKEHIMSAPYIFLFVSKIIYNFFGFNETALRFIPYISGIFSIVLSLFLCQKIFTRKEISLIFLPLFIFNYQLSYYSMQFKQYSSDVLYTIILIYLFLCFKDKISDEKSTLTAGTIFGITGFFSFPNIFVAAAMYIHFVFKFFREKKYKEIIFLTFPFVTGLITEYCINFYDTLHSDIMNSWEWENTTFIFQSFSVFMEYLQYTIGNYYYHKYFILALFILGIIYLLIKEKNILFILITPIFLNVISGFLKLYPFDISRVIVYTCPIILIIFLKPFDILGAEIIKKNFILNCLISLLIIGLGIYTCILSYNFRIKSFVIGENNYYFYTSNAKEYVKKLNTKSILQDDIIFVDRLGEGIFNVYDKNQKYNNNVIFQSFPEALSVHDPRWGEVNSQIVCLDDIPKNSHLYFYNTRLYRGDFAQMDQIEKWIKENTIIITKETDYIGDFLYVKKIK